MLLSIILKMKLGVICELLSFVPYSKKSPINVRHYYYSLARSWRSDMMLLASTREQEWTFPIKVQNQVRAYNLFMANYHPSKQWTVILASISEKWKYLLTSTLLTLHKTNIYSQKKGKKGSGSTLILTTPCHSFLEVAFAY